MAKLTKAFRLKLFCFVPVYVKKIGCGTYRTDDFTEPQANLPISRAVSLNHCSESLSIVGLDSIKRHPKQCDFDKLTDTNQSLCSPSSPTNESPRTLPPLVDANSTTSQNQSINPKTRLKEMLPIIIINPGYC